MGKLAPKITSIQIDTVIGTVYGVDVDGVTEISETTHPGQYIDIPYVRVWKGEYLFAEFCRHNIVGVFYNTPGTTAERG